MLTTSSHAAARHAEEGLAPRPANADSGADNAADDADAIDDRCVDGATAAGPSASPARSNSSSMLCRRIASAHCPASSTLRRWPQRPQNGSPPRRGAPQPSQWISSRSSAAAERALSLVYLPSTGPPISTTAVHWAQTARASAGCDERAASQQGQTSMVGVSRRVRTPPSRIAVGRRG